MIVIRRKILNQLFFVCIVFCLNPTIHIYGQEVDRQKAITAYIYNFAKHIEWKNEENIKEFYFLIFSQDKNLIQEMMTLSKTKTIRNKPIRILSSTSLDNLKNAHIVFVSKEQGSRVPEIYDQIEYENILLITDNFKDKRLIMINFFESEKGTLQFEINKANIINQNLHASDDIIILGGTVIDVAALYRESQQSLRSMQKHSEELEKKVVDLEKITLARTRELQMLKDSLDKQTSKINEQQKILQIQTQEYDLRQKELNKMKIELKKGEDILQKQKDEIERQQSEIISQSKILKEKGEIIYQQQRYVFLLIVIVILSILLAIAIYREYKRKKGITKELEKIVAQRTEDLIKSNEQLLNELTEHMRMEDELAKSEARYRHLFEKNPVPMLIYELGSFKMLAVNDAFVAHYGYSHEEALKIHLTDLYPESEKIQVADLSKELKGHAYVGEWHHIKKDGMQITIEARSHEISYQGKNARIVVITDVTERKLIEEERKRLNIELEERVKKRTAQLEAANKELEAFSYSVSHDLRAPLRHTSGYVDLLIRRFKTALPEKAKHYLESIEDSVHQMGKLIDDLLYFSRTSRKEMKVTKTDIGDIIQEVSEFLIKENKERVIKWTIGKMPVVDCDLAMMKIVWTNLLSNACKFTKTRDVAEIEIGVNESNSEYTFYVKDNGVGFDMKYAQKLFGVFQRMHSSEQFEGTGIGLATVQRIILRHEGRIWVEAELDKGATFYFTLPKIIKE